MNPQFDRTEIAPLLLPYFPAMAGKSSDDWHVFLDHITGMETPIDMPNASAFDRWRQALADQDYPVWHTTMAQAQAMRARGAELAELAGNARVAQAERTAIEMARLRKIGVVK